MSLPVLTKGSYCSTNSSQTQLCSRGPEVADRLPALAARLPLDRMDEVRARELARREHAAAEEAARMLAELLHGGPPARSGGVGTGAFQPVDQEQEVVAKREQLGRARVV